MTFERLDSIVSRVLSRVDGLGETGVDAPAQPRKRTDRTNRPAKVTEPTSTALTEANPAGEHDLSCGVVMGALPARETANRCMTAATPRARPRSAAVIHLVVDNSGREAREGWHRLPTYRSSSGGQARELKLVVV